jgi:hypothetical protein
MIGRSRTTPLSAVREALVSGALWGVIVSVIEASNQAARALSLDDYQQLLASLLITYAPTTAIWNVVLLRIVQARLPRRALAAAIAASLAAAALVSVALTHLEIRLGLAGGMVSMLGGPPELDSDILHVLWIHLFFGGLYSLAFVLHRTSAEQRLALSDAESLRAQSEGSLRQAELERLRVQIQPQLLLDVLTELRRRYELSSVKAEPLLDLAVGFLRAARSGLLQRTSTLRGELALARSYMRLCDEIGYMGRRWRWSPRTAAPEAPLPPFLLLSMIEPTARAAPRGAEIRLKTEEAPGGAYRLWIAPAAAPPPDWLPYELEFRLRTGLRATCGERAELLFETQGGRWPGGALGLLVHA